MRGPGLHPGARCGSGIPPLRTGLGFAPLRHAVGARLVNRGWRSTGGFWQAWAMSMDGELQKHYALLLGIGSP